MNKAQLNRLKEIATDEGLTVEELIDNILINYLKRSEHVTSKARKQIKSRLQELGCTLNEENSYVYILELEDGKYYVGYTSDPINRIHEHFRNASSKWIKQYPVKDIVFISEGDKKYESTVTLHLMKSKGINNVRGGWYVHATPYSDKALENILDKLKELPATLPPFVPA